MFDSLVSQMQASSIAEWIAVLLAIAYLVLAAREHITCWYAAFISAAIFWYIFFDVNLYMESALQLYYLGMAVYGYVQWTRLRSNANGPAPIITW